MVVTLHSGEIELLRNYLHFYSEHIEPPATRDIFDSTLSSLWAENRQPWHSASPTQTLMLPLRSSHFHWQCFRSSHLCPHLPSVLGVDPGAQINAEKLHIVPLLALLCLGSLWNTDPSRLPRVAILICLHFYWALFWAELCSSPNWYVEAQPPNVTAFGGRACKEVITVKWGH